MRIAVNARFLLEGKLEGIGLYTHEVVRRLVKRYPDDTFILLFDRPYSEVFLYGSNVVPVVVRPPARHPLLWWLWFEWMVPRYLRRYEADVFFTPDGYLSLRAELPQLMVMHDLAYLHYPDFIPRTTLWYYRRYVPRYLRRADVVVTVSRATAEDIGRHFPGYVRQMAVAYNGCREAFAPLTEEEIARVRNAYSGGRPYFLFVSALHPRKNAENLLLAYDLYRQSGGNIDRLMIVGRRAWHTRRLEEIYRKMKYRREVLFTGYLAERELAAVTGAAFASLYPSYFEGFGVPILEALHCEVPVITSNVSSMPEVAGNAALYVDPHAVDEIARAMHEVEDPATRARLIEEGRKQRQKFSWDTTATKIGELLHRLGQSTP